MKNKIIIGFLITMLLMCNFSVSGIITTIKINDDNNGIYLLSTTSSAEIPSSGSDGTISRSMAPSYSFARDATLGNTLSSNSNNITIGQALMHALSGDFYFIYRSFAYFDTSQIPSNAVINSAVLYVYCVAKSLDINDYSIVVQSGQPDYPNDPMQQGDYNRNYYSGNGGSLGYSSFSVNNFAQITLNAEGIGFIQKGPGAKTKLCLRSSNDINNEPIKSSIYGAFHDIIKFATCEGGHASYLVIEYTQGVTEPNVQTNDATNIKPTYATLNGEIINANGENCQIMFRYRQAGSQTWSSPSDWHCSYNTGEVFSEVVTGLTPETNYEFQAGAKNSAGTNWGDTKQFTTTQESNPNDTPQWAVGNYWIYDFNFKFKYLVIDMTGVISNMKLQVDEINEGKNEYKLKISGTINADLSLFGIISGGSYNGDIGGEARIDRSTLALKDFNIESYGHYNTIVTVDTFTTVTMTFNPAFDFFGFPIEPKEDESNPWSAETYADINGDFKLGIIDYPFNVKGSFEGEKLHFVKEEKHTVNGVTFDCILFSGSMGPTHGGSSTLWYSSDVGYLVDIQETIYGWEGVDAKLNMQLKYTNFKSDNTPPYKPVEPTGETELTTGEQYTYKTSTTDKENNNIYYKFNWGDETESEWLGPYASGSEVTASHVWDKTGSCSIRAKAKDTNDVESPWSDPLSVSVISTMPITTIRIYKISNEGMDDIDYHYPWDLGAASPEWYYKVEAISNIDTQYEKVATTSLIFNKDSYGQWLHANTWTPNTEHELLSYGSKVVITIKLMDYDEWWEGGDDLADVSGCRGDGKDNDISEDNNRGAIYHATYNLATNKLNENGYSENPDDYSDYYQIGDECIFITGDQQPDNSINADGNDAGVWFTISDNYEPPETRISDPPQTAIIGEEIQFIGEVTGGVPPYSYYWDFGDGSTSNEQNPIHVYNTADTYTVTLTVTDAFSQSDSYKTTINIIANQPPNKPSKPSGQAEGKLGKEYSYTTSTTDPEGDRISYLFDWGDGTNSGWIGSYNSGEPVSVSHTWTTKGSYSVKVKAKDVHDAESAWSDSLPVKMPLSGASLLTNVIGGISSCISNIKISTMQPESNPSAQQSSSSTTVSTATVTTISATTRQTSTIR